MLTGHRRVAWPGDSRVVGVVAIGLALLAVTAAGCGSESSGRGYPSQPIGHSAHFGMPGMISVYGVGFPSASDAVISLQQCLGCSNGESTAASKYFSWLVSTRDGGQHWQRSPRAYYVEQPFFSGANGWAGGAIAAGHGFGATARYFVSHDRGQQWRVASTAAANQGGATVSIAGGEVWAVGLSPKGVVIMFGSASGDRLTATSRQPIGGEETNVTAFAAGPRRAYASDGTRARADFVTRDDGRSWRQLVSPCPAGDPAPIVAASGATSWAYCVRDHRVIVAFFRSDDYGQSWTQLRAPAAVVQFRSVSPRVVWVLTGTGKVLRTSNGGGTWSTVLRLDSPANTPNRSADYSFLPTLVAWGPDFAALTTLQTHGDAAGHAIQSNLLEYRTTDGGRSWRAATVPLG